MRTNIPLAVVLFATTSIALAQSPSPAAAASPSTTTDKPPTAASSGARTDVYHVNFAKCALGKAAEQGENSKKQDPLSPMQGHHIVFRHQDGDSWDYASIEHLGTKATIDAARPTQPAAQRNLGEWHNDTYVNGPAWSEFAKQMGLDDASKSAGSVYVVSVYRAGAGQRDALEKFLSEPPKRPSDTSSGNVLMQHLEGSDWNFLAVTRYNSWEDLAKNESNSVADTNKNQGGWFQLRALAASHADTLCDRIAP